LRQEQEEREMREMTLDDWGNVANLMMALAAIAALLYAFVEVRSARDDSHEATAKEIWMQYHLYALQYPKLANPDSSKLDYEKWEYEGDTAQFDDYTWFVSLCCWRAMSFFAFVETQPIGIGGRSSKTTSASTGIL
jgi:hypothetical protein